MSKKKHHHEEHEEHVNHEAWVIPYADMLTLLMALFLVMWASSQADAQKARIVANGFQESLGIHGESKATGGDGILDGVRSTSPEVSPEKQVEQEAERMLAEQAEQRREAISTELLGLQQEIVNSETAVGQQDSVRFNLEARGLVVSIVSEGVLFDAGSSDLRPDGKAVIDGLVGPLKTSKNRIAIEGHSDDRPISSGRFPSNWELSGARASSVLRYLVDTHGLDPTRLSASGYADQQPVAPNSDDAGRAKNRRVDLAISSAQTAD